jgi:hypothetical protein
LAAIQVIKAQVRMYPENLKKAEREICASSSGVRNEEKIRRRLGRGMTKEQVGKRKDKVPS